MTTIIQVISRDDFESVHELLIEYLTWTTEQARNLYNVEIDLNKMLDLSMSEKDLCLPPPGRLLIAKENGQVAGIACLKMIRDDTCEIKRMYVRPAYRGKKIGHKLLNHLIQDARNIGYSKIRLDSGRFMEKAHSLYRSTGFKDIEYYSETEMPQDFQKYMIYMELEL